MMIWAGCRELRLLAVLGILIVSGAPGEIWGQVNYDSQEDTYAQDFDSLPYTGSSFTWTDSSTVPGWYAASSATAGFNPAGITTGSTTTGDLYSFGSSGSTERALGSIGSGTVGNFFWGVKFLNNTGTTITGFTISYTGEQWRRASVEQQAISVDYSFTASDIKTGSYTPILGLGFVSPDTSGTSGARDGNNSAYRTEIGPVTVSNINWMPGTALWIRFSDPDHSGSDHGLAIDDFSFSTGGGASGTYDPPAGYYNSAQGLTGQLLADALHSIISPHTVIPYTSSSTDVWDALMAIDEDPVDSTKIKLTYSGISVLKTDSSWNREHLWPQSRGIDDSGPDSSDLFNIRPCYSSVNSARGNKLFDVSDLSDANYASPAHALTASDTSKDTDSWEPGQDERGDIARSLFYMDVRYDGSDSYTSDLVLENEIANAGDMAVLSTLLSWHEADPVSEEERKRNHEIYSLHQGNRNPFIDRPEYAQLIFGGFVDLATDTDLDAIPNTWEIEHQFDEEDPSDASLDADNDGFSNFEEYWMGSDPRSSLEPVALVVDANYSGSVENGTVTQPYKTILAAVNAVPANELRAIIVQPGTYNERPYITGKNNIHLFSAQGPEATIINGQQVNSSVVRLYDFQRASFVGFTVKNAQTNWYGAGLRVDSANGVLLLAGNYISDNITTNSATGGGGVYLKAAKGSRVVNNIIANNQAVRGGAVLFAGGDVAFWHNTIVGNTATGGSGGGLSALSGVQPNVRNNILWQNVGTGANTQIHQISLATNNIIEGAASGSGNINSDPLFMDAANGNYHIASNSPARNSAVSLGLAEDFDLDLRPDTVNGQKDIGADEVPFADSGTDLDGDELPDSWETQHGFDPGNPDENNNGISDAADDFDGDGISNYQEMLGGTSPIDSGSVTNAPEIQLDTIGANQLVIYTPI